MSDQDKKEQTLEDKLKRLQEIQGILEKRTVNLSESFPLLKEAYSLKEEIEKELKNMENQLIQLSRASDADDMSQTA